VFQCHKLLWMPALNHPIQKNNLRFALGTINWNILKREVINSKKVKLSLCLIKYYTIKMYRSETESFMEVGQGPNWGCSTRGKKKHKNVWGSGCIDHVFLTSALIGGWVVSFTPWLLYPWGKSHRYHWIGGWVGHRTSLDDEKRRKIL
jgi:hypothetical protein